MKEGIDYFSIDCYMDDNVTEIESLFGVKGFGVLVKLWQKIYSEHGYYCEWTTRSTLLFLQRWFGGNGGVSADLIAQIVQNCIRVGIFDEKIYTEFGVLTSAGIQKRYLQAVSRRTEIKIVKEYLLIDVHKYGEKVSIISIDVCKSGNNVCKNLKNVCNSEQSKVNKSKVKESNNIHSATGTSPAAPSASKKDCEAIVGLFNNTVHSLPKVELLSDARVRKLKALLNKFTYEQIGLAFQKAEDSDFLSGRSGRWQNCSFDWLIKPDNVVKILEHNYDNKAQAQGNAFDQILREMADNDKRGNNKDFIDV